MAKPVKKKPLVRVPAKLYHVTSTDLVEQILRDGLRGGTTPRNREETTAKPSIFCLTDPHDNITGSVAIHQIWPCEDIAAYAVLEIDKAGIKGLVVADKVAEFTAPLHRVIRQDLIEPRFIRLHKVRELNFPGAAIHDLMHNRIDAKKPWTAADWALAKKWIDPALLGMRKRIESGK